MNSRGFRFKAWLESTDKKHSLGDYFTFLQGTATAFDELEAENAELQQQVKELQIDLDKPPQERSYCVGCSLLSPEVAEQRDCDNCSITGLLCPIRNNDPPFTFPCPHWQALEIGVAEIPELPPSDAGELLEMD